MQKLNNIPELLLEVTINRFQKRSRGTVKRWRRWSMYDLAYIYYECQAQYHLNIIASACQVISDKAKLFCVNYHEPREEAFFIEQIYTHIEIENMVFK